MSVICQKIFWTFEQKERWLNEMSRRGLHLVAARWLWRYDFVENPDLRYVYHMEYVPEISFSKRSDRFLKLLRDSGFRYLYAVGDFGFSVQEYTPDVWTAPLYRQKHYARIAERAWIQLGFAAAFLAVDSASILQMNMRYAPLDWYGVYAAIMLFYAVNAVSNIVLALRGRKEAKADLLAESAAKKG
jgi:hypothetical protein